MATESWDEYAAGWDENEAVVLYANRAFETLVQVADIAGASVFDFGCGTGLLSARIAGLAKRVVALDSSPKMIEVLAAKKIPNVEAAAGELTEDTFNQRDDFHSAFDVVVASSVCAFVPDFGRTLSLLKKLLRPGGVLIQWDWLKAEKDQGMGFTEQELRVAYRDAGLSVLSLSQPFGVGGEGEEQKVVMCVGQNVNNHSI